MIKLTELFSLEDLNTAMHNGHVREQEHPELPLWIYNYTDKCQFDREWNAVTLNCRGLIVNDKLEVVARPFPKFFNYGQPECGPLDLDAPAEVFDKLDGSLGIGYPTSGGMAIATRGSFTSAQALHATELLQKYYRDFEPLPGITPLWEIIYPENRIVVNYNGMDDLVLLGGVGSTTGDVYSPYSPYFLWNGPRAGRFEAQTLREALNMPPRPGKEGVVVRFLGGGMVKIKQDDYVALHRLVCNLSARSVWERMGAGETASDICAQLPDEFHGFVIGIARELLDKQRDIALGAFDDYSAIVRRLEWQKDWARKDFAALATQSEYRPYLFMLLDGQPVKDKIWKSLKPSGARRLVSVSEDTA